MPDPFPGGGYAPLAKSLWETSSYWWEALTLESATALAIDWADPAAKEIINSDSYGMAQLVEDLGRGGFAGKFALEKIKEDLWAANGATDETDYSGPRKFLEVKRIGEGGFDESLYLGTWWTGLNSQLGVWWYAESEEEPDDSFGGWRPEEPKSVLRFTGIAEQGNGWWCGFDTTNPNAGDDAWYFIKQLSEPMGYPPPVELWISRSDFMEQWAQESAQGSARNTSGNAVESNEIVIGDEDVESLLEELMANGAPLGQWMEDAFRNGDIEYTMTWGGKE